MALFLRFFFIFNGQPLAENAWSDMSNYLSIADQIMKGVWNENHFFQSIGYPLFINILKHSFNNWGLILSLIQALTSFLTLIFVYLLTKSSFGKRAALITLIIGSFHLPWVLLPGFALPETLFTFFLAVCAWATLKIVKENTTLSIWLWGVSFIMAFWLKGTHVLLAPLFFLGLLLYKKRAAIKPVIIISFVLLNGLGLHAYLTYSKINKVQLSASTGGLNFVEGKCASKKNEDSAGYRWHSPLYNQLRMQEFKKWDHPFTDSGYFMKKGLECIRDNPFVLIQSLESIPYLFFGNRMWPLTDTRYAVASRLYELIFAVFAIVGLTVMMNDLFSSNSPIDHKLIWVLPVLSIFLCVYIFKSELRYRVPFDVWFIPLSVKGWMTLLGRRAECEVTSKLAVNS